MSHRNKRKYWIMIYLWRYEFGHAKFGKGSKEDLVVFVVSYFSLYSNIFTCILISSPNVIWKILISSHSCGDSTAASCECRVTAPYRYEYDVLETSKQSMTPFSFLFCHMLFLPLYYNKRTKLDKKKENEAKCEQKRERSKMCEQKKKKKQKEIGKKTSI